MDNQIPFEYIPLSHTCIHMYMCSELPRAWLIRSLSPHLRAHGLIWGVIYQIWGIIVFLGTLERKWTHLSCKNIWFDVCRAHLRARAFICCELDLAWLIWELKNLFDIPRAFLVQMDLIWLQSCGTTMFEGMGGVWCLKWFDLVILLLKHWHEGKTIYLTSRGAYVSFFEFWLAV
jgi:hypothetical protein